MPRHPALALLEFDSVTAGIVAGDAMVKRAPISALHTGTVQPGHYLVLVAGEVADVEEAVDAGTSVSGDSILDLVLLPDIHPDVVEALRGARQEGEVEALGIVETISVASIIEAADAGVKGASVRLLEKRVHEGHLVRRAVISQLHDEMRANLEDHPRFGPSIGREGGGGATG